MISRQMFQTMKNALYEQKISAIVTITSHPDESLLGKTFLAWEDGRFFHEQPETEVFSSSVKEVCQALIRKRKSKCISFLFNQVEVECFVEVYQPPPHLMIAGAGHVCTPVVEIASLLGYRITVIDDRSEFATNERFPLADEVICQSYLDYFRNCPITENTWILLLTRGHRFDVISLQQLLKREEGPAYIGMIGSRRRIAGVFEQLKEEFDEGIFDHIFAPVGLDIGAETPEEIAVSIVAELLKIKNKKSGHSISEGIRQKGIRTFRGERNGSIKDNG